MAATEHLECPVCRRPFRDHSKEESIEHLREDVKIELDIVCLSKEEVANLKLNYAHGPVVLTHAIRYLERYGSEEVDAIELLKDRL